MSELSKLSRKLQETEAQLEGFRALAAPDVSADRALLEVAEQLLSGAVRERCEAFRKKLADKDPVSE